MEFRLKITKESETLFKYIASNKIISLVAIYFVISLILKTVCNIDILIPCLWKTLFKIECPGCGLTTACINLLECNIVGAFNSNPLIFIVLPIGIIYIYKDYKKFRAALTIFSNPINEDVSNT